ncbi:hypothetical protein ACFFLZ_13550 [Photobacterium aphoticum]|uniref:Uncharacterized protein n=1 Tax=Photobacterium aphoticum TaxID=754436 RepID=A0A0J1GJ61_9GAMM|nr:hypothetical protein [Photobacterium aphoticum]KLU99558.1 hypothetical protein ABT58_17120 [Photobacterium aphoticum]PSU56038.1 hypothetical protein C9I90_14210 [Photobacterium aphoticum]GHA53350.1 hypothetical protein GCM10007086_29540 [Photobacterium aphoticum]
MFIVLALATLLSGCPLDGDNGKNGETGPTGETGLSGINCWDLDGDRINDSDEDKNNDGLWDANDCVTVINAERLLQSAEAEFNHQHLCEALANLGQYPTGCPSAAHTVPTGTLTRINQNLLFDDGSGGFETCNFPPNNGLLSIELRDDLDKPGEKDAWFVLDGGYIAKTLQLAYTDVIDNNSCRNECAGDVNCIASLALESGTRAECKIFYHSDTISAYERLCGVSGGGLTPTEICALSLRGQALWDVKCP